MDCFHNTDVLQQSENDLFALRIKKNRCLLFSVNLYSCVPTEECAKKGLDTKEYSVLLLFSFLTLNIKSELFCCYLVCFLLLHKCFQSILHFICDLFI